jgi:Co/Zn/Cd efflux system component
MGETCGSGCSCETTGAAGKQSEAGAPPQAPGLDLARAAPSGCGREPDHHGHHDHHHHIGGHDHHDHHHTPASAPRATFEAMPLAPAPIANGASCSEAACGCHGNPVFDGMDRRYRMILWVVIAINAAMFVVEMIAGRLAGSQALQADALDFLGDTLTYGMSLAVIGMSLKVRATAALVKGVSLFAMGLWVFGATAYQVLVLGVPDAPVMGIVGLMALAANVASVLLLMRYKDGDANVRSVWLCSRNDAIGNVAVMGAAGAVALTASPWPDLIVAAMMAGLFLNSSISILRQAWAERRGANEIAEADAGHGHHTHAH